MSRKIKLLLLLLVVAFLIYGCPKDDPESPDIVGPSFTTSSTTPLEGDLEDYSSNLDGIVTLSSEMDTLFDELEDYLLSGTATPEGFQSRVDEIVELNDDMVPYVENLIATELLIEQAFASDMSTLGLFSSVAKGIYNGLKSTVVSTGRMVRSGYRVLSGQQSLGEVLRDPESGIPIVSSFAERLANHNRQRDESIEGAIQRGDTYEGYCDWTRVPGSTPEERIANYRNMSDDDPIKKSLRGNVHLWDTDEATRTVGTLKDAAKDGIKVVAGGAGAGDIQIAVMEQMIEDEMTPPEEHPKGTVEVTAKEQDTNIPVPDQTTIIVQRGRPEDRQKVVIVVNPEVEQEYDLPPSTYDFVTISETYIRWVEEGKTILEDTYNQFTSWMHKISDYAIITGDFRIDPVNPHPNERTTVHIDAISFYGDSLTFNWDI